MQSDPIEYGNSKMKTQYCGHHSFLGLPRVAVNSMVCNTQQWNEWVLRADLLDIGGNITTFRSYIRWSPISSKAHSLGCAEAMEMFRPSFVHRKSKHGSKVIQEATSFYFSEVWVQRGA